MTIQYQIQTGGVDQQGVIFYLPASESISSSLASMQLFLSSSQNYLITKHTSTYEIIAKLSSVKYRVQGPKMPIAQPIGMASAPSPIDAHIMKLAVFVFVSRYPNSWGRDRKRANIEAKNMPLRKEPGQAANQWWPVMAAMKLMVQPAIMPIMRILSRRDTLMVTQMRMILKAVLVIQNSEPAYVASWTVATPSMTAQDDTQLPYPTSCPMYKRKRKHVIIQTFLLMGLATWVALVWGLFSGLSMTKQMTLQRARTMPRQKQLSAPKMATRKGPMRPPSPKIVWRSWTQKSWPSPRQICMVQTLQITLMMQQQEAPMNMVMERFQKSSESEEMTKLMPPMRVAPNKMVCSLNQSRRYFTMDPPKRYPKARQKKMKEQQGSVWPVIWEKNGMMGPIDVMMLPQKVKARQQARKFTIFAAMFPIINIHHYFITLLTQHLLDKASP